MTVAWEKLIIRSLMKGTHIYAKITERHHDSYTFSPFVYLQSRASFTDLAVKYQRFKSMYGM